MSWRERLNEVVEKRTGYAVVPADRLDLLEQSDVERRFLQRDLDLLGYTALQYSEGQHQELRPETRRRIVARTRVAWMRDPQVGAAVDLTLAFVLGRGCPRPKANDPAVQEILDEAADDTDNQLVLTSYEAQCALLVDLLIQCNVFLLLFDDGADGKVKLGLLDHDTVMSVVRDPDNRLRILYYLARYTRVEWDFKTDQPRLMTPGPSNNRPGAIADAPVKGPDPTSPATPLLAGQTAPVYYEHWRNVDDVRADAAAGERELPPLCPADKLGTGKVFHVAMNRGQEMAFGVPRFDRVLRWSSAYNEFLTARVDMMSAAAAFIMKRKVKGTPQQLQRMATQALSRRSMLGLSMEPGMAADIGPKSASILSESDSVSHEPLALNTNAPQAQLDAQMLHGQIAAGTGWPQHYTGDPSSTNLAGATSLELPVLQQIYAIQQLLESVFRFLYDRAIARAVDTGRLDQTLSAKELRARKTTAPDKQPPPTNLEPSDIGEAYEEQGEQERQTKRDLGYEFRMPNPLRRMIGDLVTAAQLTAQAFDPNNTNTELSRVLLTIVLGEGFDIEDAAGAVERIFPAGYQDPAVMAAEGPPGGAPTPPSPPSGVASFGKPAPAASNGSTNGFSSDAYTGGYQDDSQDPGYGGGWAGGNPYGAVASARSPEDAMEALVAASKERAERVEEALDAEIERLLR